MIGLMISYPVVVVAGAAALLDYVQISLRHVLMLPATFGSFGRASGWATMSEGTEEEEEEE